VALAGTAAGVVGAAVLADRGTRPAPAPAGSTAATEEPQRATLPPAGETATTAALLAPAVVALADQPSISVNATLGNDFRVTINGHRTIANPAGGVDGQRITFMITHGSGSPFLVSWDSQYKFGAAGVPSLSKTAGSTDIIGFIYNQSLGSWLAVGAALGF
jgi:hypothetical protein